MFPTVLSDGIEIGYAYTSFKWENNAKKNAGVSVAVISLRHGPVTEKKIFVDDIQSPAININGYLADGPTIYINRRSKPLGPLPRMVRGSQPSDGGHLIFSIEERNRLVQQYPSANQYLRKYMGSSEFINSGERYCVWIEKSKTEHAKGIPPLRERASLVQSFRRNRKDEPTRNFANFPLSFKQPAYKPTDSIIVPSVSSERREYIPIGYLGPDTVISNAAFAVYDAEPWLFGLLTSRMHMVWTRAVGGKMKTDYRYSNTIVYNNFPVRDLTGAEKQELTEKAFRILDVREYHCEQTLAQLYDPDLMPANLRQAHAEVDRFVDGLYSKRPYETDEDRLSDLFAKYEEMIEAEEAAKPKKNSRKKA